jgi:hypothetical protein
MPPGGVAVVATFEPNKPLPGDCCVFPAALLPVFPNNPPGLDVGALSFGAPNADVDPTFPKLNEGAPDEANDDPGVVVEVFGFA